MCCSLTRNQIPTYGLAVCCCYGLFLSFPDHLARYIDSSIATEELGYDRHIWDVPLNLLVKQRKVSSIALRGTLKHTKQSQMNLAIQLEYVWGATLIKLSVLTFDRRLGVTNVTPRFIWAVRASIALVLLYWFIWTILILRQCDPFDAYWYQFLPSWVATHKYSCLNEGANTLSNTIVSTVTDFIAFMLPCSLLIKLQVSWKQKMAFFSVFAVGFLVCIVGVIRIYYITELYYQTYDVTWMAYHIFGATAVELLLATICASAPALKVYFRMFTKKGGSHNSHSSSSGRNKAEPQTHPRKSEDMGLQLHRLSKGGKGAAEVEQDIYEVKRGSSASEEFDQDIEDTSSYYPLTGEHTRTTPSIT